MFPAHSPLDVRPAMRYKGNVKPLVLAFFLAGAASANLTVSKSLERVFYPPPFGLQIYGSIYLQSDVPRPDAIGDASVFWEGYVQGDGPVRAGLATFSMSTIVGASLPGSGGSTSIFVDGLFSCETSTGINRVELPECRASGNLIPLMLGEPFLIRVSGDAEVIGQSSATVLFSLRLSLWETTGEGVLIRSVPPPTHTPEPTTFLMAAIGIVLIAVLSQRFLRSR